MGFANADCIFLLVNDAAGYLVTAEVAFYLNEAHLTVVSRVLQEWSYQRLCSVEERKDPGNLKEMLSKVLILCGWVSYAAYVSLGVVETSCFDVEKPQIQLNYM
jgi:hypothetical protein